MVLTPKPNPDLALSQGTALARTLVSGLLHRSMVFARCLVVLPHQVSHQSHSCGRLKIRTCNAAWHGHLGNGHNLRPCNIAEAWQRFEPTPDS